MLVAAILLTAGLTSQAGMPQASTLLEDTEKEFQAGVQAREHPEQARKHFAAAFRKYEAIRVQGANNAALYRDQGNAALLAGDLPAAILAYRQGLMIDPASAFLQEGLEFARDQVEYPRSDLRAAAEPWPSWLPWPSDTWLVGAAAIVYTLGCIGFTRWLMVRRLALLCGSVLVLLVAAGLGLAWEMRQQQKEQERTHPLIVVKQTTPLRTGNGMSYPPSTSLPSVRRGMEGRLQFARGDWLQIEFPGDILGWLRRDLTLLDTP